MRRNGDRRLSLAPSAALRNIRIWMLAPALSGCTGISIQPSCPAELQVGEAGTVAANELNPGAIPKYLWEVFPAERGTFDAPTSPITMFRAAQSGSAEIRLTASDGLFQAISSCQTEILGPAPVAVSLTAAPATVDAGQMVTLTCTSIGTTSATSLTIDQASGPSIRLTNVSIGVVSFTPVVEGSPQFRCIGMSDTGVMSSPSLLTLTITPALPDAGQGNMNDNGSVPPPTPPPGGGGRRGNR